MQTQLKMMEWRSICVAILGMEIMGEGDLDKARQMLQEARSNFSGNSTRAVTIILASILLMSISIGSIMGAFLTIPVQYWLGRRWANGLNILGNGIMFIAPALTHNLWLIGAAMFLGGMGSPMWTIAAAALQACIVPPELQGRVNASYRILAIGGSVLGPILAGILVQGFGFSITFTFFGILTWLQFIPFFHIITEHAITRNTLNWNAGQPTISPFKVDPLQKNLNR